MSKPPQNSCGELAEPFAMNPALSKYSVYHVYLLKSRKDDSLYIGYTSEKIEQREGAG
jgi:hypothetical protein